MRTLFSNEFFQAICFAFYIWNFNIATKPMAIARKEPNMKLHFGNFVENVSDICMSIYTYIFLFFIKFIN